MATRSPYRSPTYERRRLALALMGFVRSMRLGRAPLRGEHDYSSSDAWGMRVRLALTTGVVATQSDQAGPRYQLDPDFARFLDDIMSAAGPELVQLNAGNPRAVPARELADVLAGLGVLGWRQRSRWHGVGYVVNNRAVEASVWPIGGRITVAERYRPPPPLFVTERHGIVWRIQWRASGRASPSMTATFAPSIRRAALWQAGARRSSRRRP